MTALIFTRALSIPVLATLGVLLSLTPSTAQDTIVGGGGIIIDLPDVVLPTIPPRFAFGFTGAADQEGCEDAANSTTVDCILVSSGGTAADGAEAFSFAVTATGGSITAISTAGSDAAGLVDEGFSVSALTSGDNNEGAICAMLFSFEQDITLPPNANSTLATLTIEGTIGERTVPVLAGGGGIIDLPDLVFVTAPNEVVLTYTNGLTGNGQPVRNVATWRGQTQDVTLQSATYKLEIDRTPPAVPANLGAEGGNGEVALDWDAGSLDGGGGIVIDLPDLDDLLGLRDTYNVYRDGRLLTANISSTSYTDDTAENGRTYAYTVSSTDPCGNESDLSGEIRITPRAADRGDSNHDGRVNISDPTFTLQWLFHGEADPECLAAADSNADGGIDISDPAYTLRFLFLGGPDHPELTVCDL